MKILWVVVLVLLLGAVTHAQVTDQLVRSSIDSGYVSTTKKLISFGTTSYYKIVRAFIYHDTTDYARSPYLCYGYDTDTTAANTFKLRPGEWVDIGGVGLLNLYIWASSGTVPYRVRIER